MGGTAPSPTQSGITPFCTEYAEALSGDGCYALTSLWEISESDFYSWNTILGPNGVDCSTKLFAGYFYCIGVENSTITSSATTSTSTAVSTPSPVQSGIDPQCTKYAEAASGGTCFAFASTNGITPAQLYQWNPVLGVNGASCSTLFEANVYYCVGAPPVVAATTTTSSAPTATQSGIISTCNKYATPASGSGCDDFATANGITPTELFTWNPVLGVNGANCNSEFWANEYYCVGVSS